MRTLGRIGLAAAVPLLLACALYTPQLSSDSQNEPLMDTENSQQTSFVSKDETPLPEMRDHAPDATEGPVDLMGNEVTDAVAKYKFDATGSLYETHSPQTELPRLGSPKS